MNLSQRPSPRFWFLAVAVFLSTVGAPAKSAQVLSQWVLPLRAGEKFDLTPHERTRPLVVGEIVYAASLSGKVVAIHRTEGYQLWERKLKAGVEGAFAYGRSKIIVGDLQGNLYALNARDGSIAWQFKVQSEWLAPPLIARDRIYAATGSDELYALNEADGKEVWHFARRGDEKMTVRGTAGPTLFGNEIFQGFSDGTLVALSVDKGRVAWEKRLRSRERFYDIDMNAYADEQSVIAATFDGKLYSLDRVSGDVRWVFPVGSYGGFLVEENRLFFAGLDRKFYAVDRQNGQAIWSTDFGKGVGLTPTRAGDYIIIPTSSDPIYVLDAKTGKISEKYSLGAGTLAAAVASNDNWFFCLSNYGNLYSFQVRKDSLEKKGPATIASFSALFRI